MLTRCIYILSLWSLLVVVAVETASAADEPNALTFYRAIDDKAAANLKNLSQYNHVVISLGGVEFKYYVERRPAHVMPRTALNSVKVVKSPKYGNPKEVTGERQKSNPNSSSKANIPKPVPQDFFYSLVFTVKPTEAKRFTAFVNKNKDGSFQVKIGEHSLGVTQFYWPVEINELGGLEFAMMLREDNIENIKKILVPFQDKVIWE
jgi:hypothetical protein